MSAGRAHMILSEQHFPKFSKIFVDISEPGAVGSYSRRKWLEFWTMENGKWKMIAAVITGVWFTAFTCDPQTIVIDRSRHFTT